ncbi:MAG: M48 family metalloprotease [Gemmatimonadota bacterium]
MGQLKNSLRRAASFSGDLSSARFVRTALVLVLAVGVSTCSRNPATGERQLSLYSTQQEIQMGRQSDESIVQSMGIYEDEDLQSYVSEMGQEMAALSERPDLPWTFRVVDEPAINAFALPGGFIYVTRGILAHFNSEAQLAAVVGHEIGHVTARHSVNQISRQQLAGLGLGIGSVLSPELAQFQDVIGAGLQLAFLSFGREDERESDMLGFRYMVEAGYDPREMPGVFNMLARASEGGSRVPEWLSTHPNPENREQDIEQRIAAYEGDLSDLVVDRSEYLRLLDGIPFGQNPRNGYFIDRTFLHPDLRFRFDFPAGWQVVNQAEQVAGQPESGDAMISLRFAEGSSAEAALESFVQESGVQVVDRQSEEINGLIAEWARFRADTEQGTLEGTMAFVEYGGQVYQLMGLSTAESIGQYRGAVEATLSSFDSLREPSLLDVEPRRMQIVELPRDMTLAEFDREYPSSIPLERIAVMNQVREGDVLQAGMLYKRVVGDGPPETLP